METIKIKIYVSNQKEINAELYPSVAPKTVENFIKLIKENYYNGVIFHRVIKNFMIQTGGYYIENKSLGEKNTDSIYGEFTENGFKNDLKHTKGVLSMARTNKPNSASGQFFICSVDCPHLDNKYAAFGKVIDNESLKVVDEISKVKTTRFYYFDDFPVEPISITKIEIL